MQQKISFMAQDQVAQSGESSNASRVKSVRLLKFFFKMIAITFLLFIVGIYVVLSPPVLTTLNPGFVLYPMPPGEEYNFTTINGVTRDEVYFKTSDGVKLNGWFFQSKKGNGPVVLISHGNAGNIGYRLLLADALLEGGASVFLYDYREFGKSEGKKSLKGLELDAQAAFDYLTRERGIPSTHIVLYGESIGGGPTALLASKNKVAGIILDSCFSSLLSAGKKAIGFFQIYPDFLQPIPALNNAQALKQKSAPLLILHGKMDDLVPPSEAETNYASASEPKTFVLLPNSGHNDKSKDIVLFQNSVKTFLQSLHY